MVQRASGPMSLLQWNDSFVTGIQAADREHKNLVSMINRVHEGWQRDTSHDPEKLFDDLFNVMLSHFDSEDRMMRDCGYAARPAHAQDHDQALDQLRAVVAHADDAGCDLTVALATRLQPWLISHIRLHDAPLYRALAVARIDAAGPSTTAH